MKRIVLTGLVTFVAAHTAALAGEPPRGQTDPDPVPVSKPSDWNKMMPNKEVPMNLPSSTPIYSTPPASSSHVNSFTPPGSSTGSNPFVTPMPKIGIPSNSMLTKPATESVMQRVSRHSHDAMEFAQRGDFNHALESVDKAIALDPKIDFLYSLRSHLYGKLGKQQEAARDMERYREMQNQKNDAALDKWHQQQEQDANLPPLRERIKKLIGG